ncbi:MAG: DUF2256 and DUF3253 domain-containing protein [Deltaproteobacteria bacterium]|nr:DUF2256 and DUF3253 domain-containing protein [Deltaproteobacteria bacterium]
MTRAASKACARCGRTFAWRKRWAACWEQVRYCSEACRADRQPSVGAAYAEAIVALLAARVPEASICPSEVARTLDPEAWRDRMADVRAAALRLARAELVVVTQGPAIVDALTARGPIRLRRGPRFTASRA